MDHQNHQTKPIIRLSQMNAYTNSSLHQETITEFEKIKSGYENLDQLTTLYPGFYVLGAISSLGKTTFVHQMADQIAESGKPVIYFSLEQSTLELASKSLSRTMAKTNAMTAMTALQIRENSSVSRVVDAVNSYSKYSANLIVAECSFDTTMDEIEHTILDFIDKYQQKPVVAIDYLQAIQSPNGNHMTTKDVTDMHVKQLKQLQKEQDLILLVISSLNRQNYYSPIDYESFKESGGIEYTADVIWGLQFEALHNTTFDSANVNKKRKLIREAKAEYPRRIELVCLKNRFGPSSYSCMFNYFTQFDYFVPSE